MKKNIHTQNVSNLFKQQNSIKTNVVQASYKVANLITSETNSLSDGDFIKKCILTVIEEIIPEKLELFRWHWMRVLILPILLNCL